MDVVCGYGQKPVSFWQCHSLNGRLRAILDFWFPDSNFSWALPVCMGRRLLISINNTFKTAAWWAYKLSCLFPDSKYSWLWICAPNLNSTLSVCVDRSILIFSVVTFQMAAWWQYRIVLLLDLTGLVSEA